MHDLHVDLLAQFINFRRNIAECLIGILCLTARGYPREFPYVEGKTTRHTIAILLVAILKLLELLYLFSKNTDFRFSLTIT